MTAKGVTGPNAKGSGATAKTSDRAKAQTDEISSSLVGLRIAEEEPKSRTSNTGGADSVLETPMSSKGLSTQTDLLRGSDTPASDALGASVIMSNCVRLCGSSSMSNCKGSKTDVEDSGRLVQGTAVIEPSRKRYLITKDGPKPEKFATEGKDPQQASPNDGRAVSN